MLQMKLQKVSTTNPAKGVGGGYRNRTDLNSCLQGKRPPHADPSPIFSAFYRTFIILFLPTNIYL